MPSRNRYYDNTMLSGYKKCPRYYMLRHILEWRREGVALPLIFGLSWHSAMDIVWQYASKVPDDAELANLAALKFIETWEENGLPGKMDIAQLETYGNRTPLVAHEMLLNYIAQRRRLIEGSELLACEQPFAVPVPGMEGRWYVGRMDKVARPANQTLLVVEHKTTSEYKKDGGFKALYIEGWFNDSQVKGYQFGGALFYPGLTQVWVDAALVHKSVHDAFRFIPVQHQYPLLEEWVHDTAEWITRVETDTRALEENGRLTKGIFPKNEESCLGKFGPCQFLDICRTTTDASLLEEVPVGFVKEKWEPFELLGLDKIINKE